MAKPPESPAIDAEDLRNFLRESGLEREDLRDLFELFLEDAPDHLDNLRTAARVGEANGLASAAHAFKSPSALIRARVLAAQLESIERAARAGEIAAPNTIDAVAAELQRVVRAIHNYE